MRQRARRVVQEIGGSELSRWIFAFLLLAACGRTPADAIIPVATGPDGGDGCAGVALVSAGLFRLRATSGQCLDVGPTTFIGISPAHETVMTNDCATSETWELKTMTSSVVSGSVVYEVAASSVDESLDITMAITSDGTAAITFESTGNPNQEFLFRPRRSNVFEIAPVHVLGQTSCLASQATPAIWRCSVAATDQDWMLIPAECS